MANYLHSDLSDTDELTIVELQVANSSACLEYNIVNPVVHDGESSDDVTKANGEPISSSFSFHDNELEHAKSILDIEELKEFQIKCILSVKEGKDVVVIQPADSGKSACYTIPALLYFLAIKLPL